MTNFDLWVRGCEINDTQIYPLEPSPKPCTGLYQTKRQYECEHNYYWTTPMYHVWIDDEHTVVKDYVEAIRIYEKRLDK